MPVEKKITALVIFGILIGIIAWFLPIQEDIAFEYILNNTDLYNNGRLQDVTYTANDSAIQLFLIFHVVGTGASLAVDTNLSINGTVVEDRDYRTTAGAGIHEHFSMTAHIPKGANYSVTNSSNLETIEWREYPILSGKNGTLSVNITQGGGTGSQNLSQVLNQGNTTNGQRINFTNSGNWLNVGYNSDSGLMEANTASILYYKQAGTFIGFQGGGFAYSSYDNKPMKFGQSGTNYSQILYNTTYGTTLQGVGNLANRLNITGFDKVNFYQDLEMNENNLTGAYFINQSIINGSFGGFAFLGSATTQFYQAWENSSIIRTELTYGGSQAWKLRNTDAGGKNEAGYIVYSTPGGFPGITFYNSTIKFRSNMFETDDGAARKGFMINSDNGSAPKNTGLLVDVNDNVTIDGLAGTGNAYVCVDANGKLYRGNPTC